MPTSRETNFWTWLGLAMFVAGAILWIFPLLPVQAAGGGPMRHVPHWPQWETAGLSGLGIGILLGSKRSKPPN